MTVLVDGKYYEDATYNTQFISVMNGQAVPVPDEVPDPKEADNGKVLTVVEGVAAWADAPVELPVSEVADNGKVLTVDENGTPAWQAPTHPAQFEIGADAPTDTAVLWVDTAGANPVLKVYISDAWVAVVNPAE
jgi:hypothetical protein